MAIDSSTRAGTVARASWTPLIGLFLAQVLMSFNVAALPVSLGGMVEEFDVPATVASSTIVVYGLAVAGLVMLGAKLGQRIGWLLIFRIVVAMFAASATMMLLAPSVGWAIAGQGVAGASAAVIVPALVALIAENYRGEQQAQAIGSLGSARAISGVSAFFIGGALGTAVGWRPVFLIVLALAVAVFVFSFWLRADRGDPAVRIDGVGAVLIGAAVILLTLGFNNLNSWGLLAAREQAPFDIAGVSPAPIFVVLGVVLGQAFFAWTRSRTGRGQVPLVNLGVLGSRQERAAVYAMFIVVSLEAALNFTVPLYIQIVQGRTPFDTALAMMPFNLTVFFAALLVVRFYKRFSPRRIALFSFSCCAAALTWLSLVVTNNWETLPTILGLFVFGVGQGSLVTLVFNVLVTASPKELAGDVGSVRGATQNLASAVGTALAGALLVTLLAIGLGSAIIAHPELPDDLKEQAGLEDVTFLSNEQVREALDSAGIAPEVADAAVEVNEEARLDALRRGLLVYAAIALVAMLPASRLPRYRPHEIPDPSPAAGD